MSEAYKVLALRGEKLPSLRAFYLATRGGADALGMGEQIGSFEPGREADFVVLDPTSTKLLARRIEHSDSLSDYLFALMMLGDDRTIDATYLRGSMVSGLSGKPSKTLNTAERPATQCF